MTLNLLDDTGPPLGTQIEKGVLDILMQSRRNLLRTQDLVRIARVNQTLRHAGEFG